MTSNRSRAAIAAATPQSGKTVPHQAVPVEYAEAFTIKQFCLAHAICRQTLYLLWGRGLGPNYFLIGTHRRITREDARAWREARRPPQALSA